MVGVDWRLLIEALGEAEPVATLLPYSDESTTEDEFDIERSYDWHNRPFLKQRMGKQIAFRKRVKEANANPKHVNLVSRPWPRSKKVSRYQIFKKVMPTSEIPEYIRKTAHYR